MKRTISERRKSKVSKYIFVHHLPRLSHLFFVDAIRACFYHDDDDRLDGFWYFEGKIIRGNQRRGLVHRKKQTYSILLHDVTLRKL